MAAHGCGADDVRAHRQGHRAGLAGNFSQRFPKWILFAFVFALLAANTISTGVAVWQMQPRWSGKHQFPLVRGCVCAFDFIGDGQASIQAIALRLKRLVLVFAYPVTAFVVGADWGQVLRDTLVPSIPRSKDEWATLVAILGTTISPYLFFWQASEEVEEEKSAGQNTLALRRGATAEELSLRNIDVGVGAFFSNMVMFFIILTTAITLNRHYITQIQRSPACSSTAALRRQVRHNPLHAWHCRCRFPGHPHAGGIDCLCFCRNTGLAPGPEQEAAPGALVLRAHFGFHSCWGGAGFHRHQPREGTLLDGCHQRIARALSSGGHPCDCGGQQADARPAKLAPGMDCCSSYDSSHVHRGRCNVCRLVPLKPAPRFNLALILEFLSSSIQSWHGSHESLEQGVQCAPPRFLRGRYPDTSRRKSESGGARRFVCVLFGFC